jgi:probable F420-dependent oxidoreductase
VRLGLVFPQTEIGSDVALIREYAIRAEKTGYDFLAAYDHVAGHRPVDPDKWKALGPYTDAHAFHEIFVLFSYLAAITSKIEFATEVLVLPQRQTLLVAKQAGELHLLSGGRLRLGIGVGWNPEEYRALGLDFHDRGKRVVEQIDVMRRLWTEDVITYQGRYHNLEAVGIRPRPAVPTIPIWIGGYASVAIKRAASIGDGFVFDHSIKEAPAVLLELQRHLAEFKRHKESFGMAARVQLHPDNPEATVAKALAWQRLGITHLSVNTMNLGITDPRMHLNLAVEFMNTWQAAGHA